MTDTSECPKCKMHSPSFFCQYCGTDKQDLLKKGNSCFLCKFGRPTFSFTSGDDRMIVRCEAQENKILPEKFSDEPECKLFVKSSSEFLGRINYERK